jgi:hypothetical protein
LDGIVSWNNPLWFEMRDAAAQVDRRIERAQETQAAFARAKADPSRENLAALHRLHAEHLQEDGDLEGAARAEKSAKHAESMTERLRPLTD